eukprot:scaffold33937_cov66-Attheya_sp.AAC.2
MGGKGGGASDLESVVPASIPGIITYLCNFFKSCGRRVPAISFEAVVWNVLLVNGRFIFFIPMELLTPEIEAGAILPLCILPTNEGCWDPGSSQATVGCSDKCNA